MEDKTFKIGLTPTDLENFINKANSAAPQLSTYSKKEWDQSQSDQDERLDDVEKKIDELTPHQTTEHYGIKIDKNNSDTFERISYLYDAVNFTPAYMDFESGKFEYGSWKDSFFMKNNYPCMVKNDGTEDYKLDPNDHTLKADGSASDVANLDYAGNAFSCFDCHIWMKFYEDDNYCYAEIANDKLDDDFVDYPYHRGDESVADKLYYPMYPGYVDSNSRLRSISGVKASSSSTATQEVTYAENNGSIWSIESWSYHVWFSILLILISKNYNAQAAFGNGNMLGGSSASDFKTNGLLNTSGPFFGYNTDSDSVKCFFVENPYANRYSRCLGLYNDKGTYKIKMAPPYTVDETFEGYIAIDTPTVPAGGYLREFSFSNTYGLLPSSTSNASATTYVGDYFLRNTPSVYLALLGGVCSDGTSCGPFCAYLSVRAIGSIWLFGASLYLK